METKSAVINLRVEPKLKEAAEEAARRDRRSLTNLIEFLLVKHCESLDIWLEENKNHKSEG